MGLVINDNRRYKSPRNLKQPKPASLLEALIRILSQLSNECNGLKENDEIEENNEVILILIID